MISCHIYHQTDLITEELVRVFGPTRSKEILLVLVPEVSETQEMS